MLQKFCVNFFNNIPVNVEKVSPDTPLGLAFEVENLKKEIGSHVLWAVDKEHAMELSKSLLEIINKTHE